jgi:energy-coupling factor transporter transmembrane protein EcfT
VSLRRIFLLGAATLICVAALGAIVAIVNGDFGDTEGKFFATLATAFVAGSAAIAGIACLERSVARPFGVVGVGLALLGFVLWTEQIWAEHHGDAYWKLLGLILTWTLALLLVTTTRLMTRSPVLLRRLYPATTVAAFGAGLVVSLMVLRENGDGWQLFAVLLVLALLGEMLTPILQRYVATPDGAPAERVLGEIAGAVVLAVRESGAGRSVRVGDRDVSLADDERVVIRPV